MRKRMLLSTFFILFLCTLGQSQNQMVSIDSNGQTLNNKSRNRSFTIDCENDTFLMDGKPFRYVSGSFHYFRAHHDSWRRKLRTMRAAGLNAVSTYVEWSTHNPKDGVYTWEGMADLVKFVELAQQEDLYVILRPGPYICAERDNGGIPYWLFTKYPDIKLRTSDINYLHEVRVWYSILMPKMEPLLYENGGPIIMVQVENEYGSFSACDKKYTTWLRDETYQYVQDKALLFTTDGGSMLRCGAIEGVFATIDFGSSINTKNEWNKLRRYQAHGPLVNSEFYPGWLTHWQERMQRVATRGVIKTFKDLLDDGASVNFYMFFGGTNFGFSAGANDVGPGKYRSDLTSYDYDAPMDEAGDVTEKYIAIRNMVSEYLPMPNISVPSPEPKRSYGKVTLTPFGSILSPEGRKFLSTGTEQSRTPLMFEDLDQNAGLVLYETDLPKFKKDSMNLKVAVKDRAYVYVDENFVGILSREDPITSLRIASGAGKRLQILVESEGRINYNIANDKKGIPGSVLLDHYVLLDWHMTKIPLEDYEQIENFLRNSSVGEHILTWESNNDNEKILKTGPTLFYGEFNILDDDIFDTYLDPSDWGKGVVFVNGFNLGRYWPIVGPQITLYVPKEILRKGVNKVVLLEYQTKSVTNEILFRNNARLDG